MQKNSLSFTLVASLALLSSFCTNHNSIAMNKGLTNTAKRPGFAVVELFTSEGCSSCPSADKAVEELQKQYPDDVYVLAFHVDYWNRLGWTDEFSKAEYTQRQSNYATQFNLESIYTPQVVINGKKEFVGSDKVKLETTTANEKKNAVTKNIELTTAQEGATVTVNYTTTGTSGEELHLALIQNEATTDVKKGENGGRKLHHINLVRDYKTVGLSSPQGTANLKLPQGLSISGIKIIAYLQAKNGTITAVKKIAVGGV